MRTASVCLFAILFAACTTPSSSRGPGTAGADAAARADAAQADQALASDGQTESTTVTAEATRTISTTVTGTDTRTSSTTGSGTGTGTASGTGSSSGTGSVTAASTGSSTGGGLWKPSSTPRIIWDWQIGASSDAAIIPPAGSQMIDVDGFNVSAQKVAALHAAGLKVVCYLDVGSYETGRPDSADYPAALKLSEDPDWPGEWFLDTRDVF